MDLAIDDKNLSSMSQHRESPIALPPFSLSNAQVFQAAMSATNASLQQQSSSAAPSFPSGVPPTLLSTSQIFTNSQSNPSSANSTSKYAQLLGVIEELGKDIRPTYSGSKSSAERLKRGIIHSRILVRECLMETERNNARN